MSYLSKIHSIAEGQPVDLYQFTLGKDEKFGVIATPTKTS